MPKIIKPINEFATYVAFPGVELIEDYAKRFYAVPKDYRIEGNPQEADPGSYYLGDIENDETKAFNEALQLMSQWYWKILAEDAERTYQLNK